ncbi:MAG: YwiC-like family protein [Actinomycetia bacterium]|nr:YwiC-like family protein [Actinomycetes bacterium]
MPPDRVVDSDTARPRSVLRTVAVPAEHGGWSLTLEPVFLGLLVAWSWAGLALGLAALLAFLARTPLKLVLVDKFRERWLDRTRLAMRVAAVELALLAILALVAVAVGESGFWWPLVVAGPLITVELWFDMRSRSRRLIPELCGTAGISSMAAVIALADGAETSLAVGLWAVVAARASAAIPYVRTQLFRARNRPYQLWHSDLAQVLAVGVTTVAWLLDAIPMAPVVALAVVGIINAVAVRRPPRPPKVLGFQQMGFGIAVIVVTATAVSIT